MYCLYCCIENFGTQSAKQALSMIFAMFFFFFFSVFVATNNSLKMVGNRIFFVTLRLMYIFSLNFRYFYIITSNSCDSFLNKRSTIKTTNRKYSCFETLTVTVPKMTNGAKNKNKTNHSEMFICNIYMLYTYIHTYIYIYI